MCYSVCMIIKIEAIKPLATQRTRNRIREIGPIFEDVTREFTGKNSVAGRILLRGQRDWLGWLPISEFRVIDTKESD